MKLQHNAPLVGYTSLHVGGQAEILIELERGESLEKTVKNAEQPVWVLGYGTNVLISDKGLPGTVIINRFGSIDIEKDGLIRADSGADWDELVRKAIEHNLWGLEFTSGIPGGIGAAVAGNIAAYGHKVSDSFTEATMLDTKTGNISKWESDDFGFGYRSSSLQTAENRRFVVLEVIFKLKNSPTGELEYGSALKVAAELGIKPDSLGSRRRIIMEARRRAGSLLLAPGEDHFTAGSFFKNPMIDESQVQSILKHEESAISREQLLRQNVIHGGSQARVSAAHVLLAAGFKRGQTWGQVRLHPDHILKVENIGGATAAQIYDVVMDIIFTVKQKLDVTLEPEVRFLGEF